MKILITGMNKNQTTKDFYLRQQLKVVPSHYSLIRCLEDMGYEVEQRLVKIGEDLSDYDKVICFLASPTNHKWKAKLCIEQICFPKISFEWIRCLTYDLE